MAYEFSVKVKECPLGIPHAVVNVLLSDKALDTIHAVIMHEMRNDAWIYNVHISVEARIPVLEPLGREYKEVPNKKAEHPQGERGGEK